MSPDHLFFIVESLFHPYIQSKSLLSKFETISLCPITKDLAKESVPFFLTALFWILKGHSRITLELSLLKAELPQISQPVFIGEVLHPKGFTSLLY